jgi:stalled ribosome alternative rescue factor ArfA
MCEVYQTDFLCTYKLFDDNYTDYLYKIQLMQAFNINTWDDIIVNNVCNKLYETLIKNEMFRDIVEKASKTKDIKEIYDYITSHENIHNEKQKIIFSLLFKYEYFDLIHHCIIEQFNNGYVRENTINMIMNKL